MFCEVGEKIKFRGINKKFEKYFAGFSDGFFFGGGGGQRIHTHVVVV